MPKRKRETKQTMALQRCRPKRKRETKEAMALRLADVSGRTLEECMRMTQVEIDAKLKDLDLTGRLSGYNEGQSWEERAAAKAKKAAEKAEKPAEKAEKVLQFDAEGQIVPIKRKTTYTTAAGVAKASPPGFADALSEDASKMFEEMKLATYR